MALSNIEYYVTSPDGQDTFSVPFSYISKEHVHVHVDDVEVTDFTWQTDHSITLSSTAGKDTVVYIYRDTPKDARMVDFTQAALLDEATLDLDSNQIFFVMQEVDDENQESMTQDFAGRWDAESRIITDIKDPVGNSDAVTKGWLNTSVDSKYNSMLSTLSEAKSASRQALTAKDFAINAKDFALSYRDETKVYRDDTEAYRDEVYQVQINIDQAQADIEDAKDDALDEIMPYVAQAEAAATNANTSEGYAFQYRNECQTIYQDTLDLGCDASHFHVNQYNELALDDYDLNPWSLVPSTGNTGKLGTSHTKWGEANIGLVKAASVNADVVSAVNLNQDGTFYQDGQAVIHGPQGSVHVEADEVRSPRFDGDDAEFHLNLTVNGEAHFHDQLVLHDWLLGQGGRIYRPNIHGYTEVPGTPAVNGGILSLGAYNNFYRHTLTENTTIVKDLGSFDDIPLSDGITPNVWRCTLVLTQADPAVTVTWPTDTYWSDATEPDLSGAGQTYVITLFTENKGVSFYGFLAGQNMGIPV